jgi:hypothetical protein
MEDQFQDDFSKSYWKTKKLKKKNFSKSKDKKTLKFGF